MKRLSAALLPATLLAATVATPAHAAEPAPTNVTIRWVDATHQAIRLTWDETSPQPNWIILQGKENTTPIGQFWTTADEPNQVDIPATSMSAGAHDLRMAVAVGSKDGGISPLTGSPRFDTTLPPMPELVSSAISGSSTLTAQWKSGPAATDTTPDDPLDVTGPAVFQASYQVGSKDPVTVGPTGPATKLTFTAPGPAFAFSVAQVNEWGPSTAKLVDAAASAPTLTVPSWVVYDNLLDLTGEIAGTDPRTVILQARNTPAGAWYTVASRVNTTGSYRFTFQSTPSRQYRVQVPNTTAGARVWYGGYSAIGTNNVQHKVYGVFPRPTINRGETARAALTVHPAYNGTAVLQRYSGTAWTTVGPVGFTSGIGNGYVRSTAPGRVSYRYYVPTATVGGGTYHAAYSSIFVLTTT
ncbi:hypothetical protein BWI15_36045 [Kribbella sp. ALI-6-A]|uniref:hypothetical protein n=1 Tax=Kribbella sp. ALI-6-A TaxID=1933817 RepID=UPI00097C2525|nr:hypothetical protein [Kribbella sp. ALI-6-A]ONI68407.1 hypothetical protein BWI15_36045 [Kribbella sp. ALI-6-A]